MEYVVGGIYLLFVACPSCEIFMGAWKFEGYQAADDYGMIKYPMFTCLACESTQVFIRKKL